MGNTAAPPESELREAFHWRFGESGPDVRMRWLAMIGIEAEVIEGFKALPRRGAEVGGALLGHEGAAGEFVIDAWRPIPIEHRAGPSYVLSEADLASWKAFAASARAAGEGLIGIYRSQTRPGLGVTREDCAIVEKFLPREKGVLLIVKPLSISESVATFYLCEGGAILESSGESREFAFGGKAVPPGAVLGLAEPEEPERAASVEASETVAAPERRARRSHARWMAAIGPLSAVLAGSAAGVYVHSRNGMAAENPVPASFEQVQVRAGERESPERELNLRAQRGPDGITLLWNTGSPVLKKAEGGDLLIENPGSRTELRLSADQLRSGLLHWRSSAGATRFEIRVIDGAGGEYFESVRVIEPGAAERGGRTAP